MRPVVVLLLLTSTASATPLTFGVALGAGHLGTQTTDDDSPSGTAAGVQLSAGTPNLALELGWAHTRDRHVQDPFDPPDHDISVDWIEVAATYRHDVFDHAWAGGRVAYGHLRDHEHTPNEGTYGYSGLALGVRAGYDFVRTEHDAFGAFVDGEVLVLGAGPIPLDGAVALIGVAYRFTR